MLETLDGGTQGGHRRLFTCDQMIIENRELVNAHSHCAQQTHIRQIQLVSAALAYAKLGIYIIPLHEPLFDNSGNLIGCTCEAYKRSAKYKAWLESKGRRDRFDPNYVCRTPGKHPRLSDWETNASNDPEQIRKWWKQWPTANIGGAMGKSSLIAVDHDTYKDDYAGAALITRADEDTPTSITQSGGAHLHFKKPAGKTYTNANNTLPDGVDIRCDGGMTVLAPSIGPTGNLYQWEDGYSIFEIEPLPLPKALEAILDAAQQNSTVAKAVAFTTPTTEKPLLLKWRISEAIRDLIDNAPAKGGRSDADCSVCLALIYAGATDDEILAVFQHYPIGTQGKYTEAGPGYLARTIGKARGFAYAKPRPDINATVDNLLLWARTHSFEQFTPAYRAGKHYLTDATDTKIADAILCEMKDKQRLAINIGKKRLGKLAGVGCNTALRALTRLNGWLFDVTVDPLHGACVTLCDSSRLQQMDPLLASSFVFKRDPFAANDVTIPEINEYSSHKADEPFLIGTSKLVRERIQDIAQATDITPKQAKDEYTFASFGEPVIRVIDVFLRAGDMTAKELTQETGKKMSSIRTALRKLVQHGLVDASRPSVLSPYNYSLCDDVWSRIEIITPNLRTYTIAARRENKRLESAQQWCKKGIAEATEAQNTEQAVRLERRLAKLAKDRLPHLERLYADRGLLANDIKRMAYEVADYKRSPKTEATIRTWRAEDRTEHRETVRLVADLVAETLDAGITKADVLTTVLKYGFEESTVRAVLQSKNLIDHAAMKVGVEILARNIAAYKAAGVSKSNASRELQVAGFIPGEIERAWAGTS